MTEIPGVFHLFILLITLLRSERVLEQIEKELAKLMVRHLVLRPG